MRKRSMRRRPPWWFMPVVMAGMGGVALMSAWLLESSL